MTEEELRESLMDREIGLLTEEQQFVIVSMIEYMVRCNVAEREFEKSNIFKKKVADC
jgi:hypothetical protein